MVDCVPDIVNAIPVPSYNPSLSAFAERDPVDLKVKDAATGKSFDIFNFEGIVY